MYFSIYQIGYFFVRSDSSCCPSDKTDLIPQKHHRIEYKKSTKYIIHRLLNRNNSLLFSSTILRSTSTRKNVKARKKFRQITFYSGLNKNILNCGVLPPPGGYFCTAIL